jgi:hypothetical protein
MKTTQKLNKYGRKTVLAPFRWCIIQSIVLFSAAGTLKFPNAWLYLSLILLSSLISAVIMWKLIPELANQRGSMKSRHGQSFGAIFLLMSQLYVVCRMRKVQWTTIFSS